jgi:hypothetical protein
MTCPRAGTNEGCKGHLCGHCKRCGRLLDNHKGLGVGKPPPVPHCPQTA